MLWYSKYQYSVQRVYILVIINCYDNHDVVTDIGRNPYANNRENRTDIGQNPDADISHNQDQKLSLLKHAVQLGYFLGYFNLIKELLVAVFSVNFRRPRTQMTDRQFV